MINRGEKRATVKGGESISESRECINNKKKRTSKVVIYFLHLSLGFSNEEYSQVPCF